MASALLGAACASDETTDLTDDSEPASSEAITEEPPSTDATETTDAPDTTEAPDSATTTATTPVTNPGTTQAPETTTTEPLPPPEEPFDVSLATLVGRPADTNSLNGVSVSPLDGNVYVASVGGTRSRSTIPRPVTSSIASAPNAA